MAQTSAIDPNTIVTDGSVYAIERDASYIYLAGSFSHVGPSVTGGIAIDLTTGSPDLSMVMPTGGAVHVAVPDGSGGWYIGGAFNAVNGQSRWGIARINADGSLNAWSSDTNLGGIVYAILVSGSTVFVGGNFSGIGGQTRNNIAALDPTTGLATSWNPNANGTVYTLAMVGGAIYAGGSFSSIGGYSITALTALDMTTGTNTGWAISSSVVSGGTVSTLAVNGSTLYVGGNFTSLGGQPRQSIGAIDAGSGAATSWNPAPSVSSSVSAMHISGGVMYVGGSFSSMGGQVRNNIAAVDMSTGNTTAWNPNADGAVDALAMNGGMIYAGGKFANIGGQSRNHIAAIDVSSANASSWDPNANDEIYTLSCVGSKVYAGGKYLSIGGKNRNNLAAFSISTGAITGWDPSPNGLVRSMIISGSNMFIGGAFTTVGGQTRNRVARLDLSSGTPDAFHPDVNGVVRTLALSGSSLYLGGEFTGVGGYTRNYIASVDAGTAAISTWDPQADNNVSAIVVDGSLIYAGGSFSMIGGQARNRLAAINGLGVASAWDPNANGNVSTMAIRDGLVYAGGSFTSIGGQLRNRIAAVNASTGLATDWNPNANNQISVLKISGGIIYAGGWFTSIGGQSRNSMAAIDLMTGLANAWNPNVNSNVLNVMVSERKVFIAGQFSAVSVKARRGFASFPITSLSWGGSTGDNWSDPVKWSPGLAPASDLNLTISSGYPVMDVDFTQSSTYTLTLSGTGGLVIAPGKTLTIAGTTNFGGKSVTLRSSADGTAAIGRITGSLTGATNVTVERYLPAGRKWRLLGAPLTGSVNTSVYYHWQNNGVPNGSTGVEIWGPGGSSTPTSANTGLAYGASASMRSYDGVWQPVTNTNGTHLFNATTNNGFALFQTGPFNSGSPDYIGSSGYLPAAVPTTLSATGSLITGTHIKNFNATSAGQYFLVANPYAAPVNPASFTVSSTLRSNLDNVLYMWDAKPNTGNGVGRYVYYNIDGGIYSQIGAGTGFADHSVQIQSGQAFFVRASGAGAATLTFMEASKGTSSSHAMLGNSTKPARSNLRMQLKQEGVSLDGAVALFHAGASRGLDAFDGVKMLNTTDNLSLRRAGRSLVFEHRPELTVMDTLFLHLGQMRQATYALRLEGEGLTLPSGMNARLLDRFTGASVFLDISQPTIFDFKVTADTASTGDRFMVVFGGSGASGQTPEPGGQAAAGLRVHPNPVSATIPLTVEIDPSRGPWELRLTDISGRVVWQQSGLQPASGRSQIRMSAFGSGVYHLVATDASGQRNITRIVRQ